MGAALSRPEWPCPGRSGTVPACWARPGGGSIIPGGLALSRRVRLRGRTHRGSADRGPRAHAQMPGLVANARNSGAGTAREVTEREGREGKGKAGKGGGRRGRPGAGKGGRERRRAGERARRARPLLSGTPSAGSGRAAPGAASPPSAGAEPAQPALEPRDPFPAFQGDPGGAGPALPEPGARPGSVRNARAGASPL